jgi:peptidoglycan/xylan/chitin deacetylase (PgdA/CDA1 family)
MNLRLDRLVTVYLASPWMRIAAGKRLSIPILMYHSIADEDESKTSAYYRTTTVPSVFADQMRYLRSEGYRTCSLAEVITRLLTNCKNETKSVAITFDDGYHDFYQNAFPVLNECGFMATVFLPTAYIGESRLQFKGKNCLTWSEVKELQRNGVEFGSHTVTHPQLQRLNRCAIEREVVDSKREIEQKTGYCVTSFAYPYAFPETEPDIKRILRETLRSAGYQNGVCTVVGRVRGASDPLFLKRLPVNSLDDTALFHAKLVGAYDWINRPQTAIKAAKGIAARICRHE